MIREANREKWRRTMPSGAQPNHPYDRSFPGLSRKHGELEQFRRTTPVGAILPSLGVPAGAGKGLGI